MIENQLPSLKAYCQNGNHDLAGIYQENETAWRLGHQKELARLLNDLRNGGRKYDAVLVWSLDRLTRGGVAEILTLVNTFKTYGCKIISLQETWTQMNGAVTELLYAVTGWVAKFESDRRSERVRAGQERARAQGKHLGRPQGKKDREPRKTIGYHLRYADKKVSAKNGGDFQEREGGSK